MPIAWFYEMAYKYFKIAADNGHEMSAELIKR